MKAHLNCFFACIIFNRLLTPARYMDVFLPANEAFYFVVVVLVVLVLVRIAISQIKAF
jgi:hypothetical protein